MPDILDFLKVREYNVGDDVGIHIGSGRLSKGKVVHKFSLAGWLFPYHYVIEVPTHIDPILEVRDGSFLCMRPWIDGMEEETDE